VKDMKKEVKEYTDILAARELKKQVKECIDMEKSCKNCRREEGCRLAAYAWGDFGDVPLEYCSLFEPKKKTVKLFRYTYDYNSIIYQSEWTSENEELYFELNTHKKPLKTEEKEIQI